MRLGGGDEKVTERSFPPEPDASCDDAKRCFWCSEPLDDRTADEMRPWSAFGCCRFCKELE